VNRILIVLMALVAPYAAVADALPADYEALAAAEREFAADGLRDGVQKSFLAHFAADATVLRPFAMSGVEYYRAHPDKPGKLIWAPQYLAVSAAGDLGVSSGPWRYEAERKGQPVLAHGHFFSIWQRDAGGRWQVVFDHGVGHDAAKVGVEATPLVALLGAAPPARGMRGEQRRKALIAADDALRKRLARDRVHGYAKAARADTLWLREGAQPQRAPAPPAAQDGATQGCGCGPRARTGMAASGDFGYTIGGSESERAKGIYVRVWRYQPRAGWALLADLTAPVE